jgi:hypothetical protein
MGWPAALSCNIWKLGRQQDNSSSSISISISRQWWQAQQTQAEENKESALQRRLLTHDAGEWK